MHIYVEAILLLVVEMISFTNVFHSCRTAKMNNRSFYAIDYLSHVNLILILRM